MLFILPKQVIDIILPLLLHTDLILFCELLCRRHALLQRQFAVLQNPEQNISRVFQLGEHHEVKLFKIILLVGLLLQKTHRLFAGQDNPCSFRAGKGQG